MSVANSKMAYVDSDVCINWLQGNSTAHDFFKLIEDGALVGIISRIVLMEIIRVFREFASRSGRCGSEVETEIKEHVKSLLSISHLYILEERIRNIRIPYSNLSSRALEILIHNHGRRYKRRLIAIHVADACHLVLAEEYCDIFVTSSKDIRETSRVKISRYILPNEIDIIKNSVS